MNIDKPIKLKGYRGTWEAVQCLKYKGEKVYLLVCKHLRDMTPSIIVNSKLEVLPESVYYELLDLGYELEET